MQLKGIDVAWDKPSVADIKATGAKWVARYFSTDPTKDLTPGEVSQYTAAGLAIVTVWETSTGRALQGAHAGVQDAQAAMQERAACGLPQTCPIHFAVDMDAQWSQVQSYFDGVTSVLGKDLTGVYGGIKIANGAHTYGLKYIWQADAWSYGQWSAWATIRQTGGTTLGGGADFDYAEVPDFGQYPRPEEIVTPQDKQDIANLVLAGMPAVLESGPVRDTYANANLWWLEHVLSGQTTPGMDAYQVSLIQEIHRLVTALEAAPKAAAAGVSPTV